MPSKCKSAKCKNTRLDKIWKDVTGKRKDCLMVDDFEQLLSNKAMKGDESRAKLLLHALKCRSCNRMLRIMIEAQNAIESTMKRIENNPSL